MRRHKTLFFAFAMIFLAASVFATNGYFSHGYGAKSKGMAGAGTAMVFGTLDSVSNPAALVFLGKQVDFGLAAFMPKREFTVTGNPSMYPGTFPLTPGTVESDSNLFLMPHVGANFMLNENTSFGIAAYGNGGMNTNYDASVFYGTSPTGVNLMQMFVDFTLSRKLAENHSIGITAIVAYQMFKAEGLQAFSNFSSNAAALTNNDTDGSFGFGFRVGYMGQFSKYFTIGASYQTKMSMGEFKDYAGLFAQEGDFDIPATFNVGIAIHPSESFSLAFDVQHIQYSKIKSIANVLNPMNFYQGILLGMEEGAGFGWEDMTIFKTGIQWKTNANFTLRAGFSTGKQPIPSSEVLFNILAPGVIEQHITLGGTFTLQNDNQLTFYFSHAFSKTVDGPNPMEAPGQQMIQLKMNQMEFGIEYSL